MESNSFTILFGIESEFYTSEWETVIDEPTQKEDQFDWLTSPIAQFIILD